MYLEEIACATEPETLAKWEELHSCDEMYTSYNLMNKQEIHKEINIDFVKINVYAIYLKVHTNLAIKMLTRS